MATRSLPRNAFGPLALLLAALSAASCGGDAEFQTEDVAEEDSAYTVCAAGTTVEGIDVSVWQQSVNWSAVKQAGITFAIARAAYGTSKDTYFDANWSGMKSAGLVRGAYTYFRPSQDAIAQANVMLAAIGTLGPKDLPPVIDVETTEGQTAATIVSKMKQWLDHIEAAIGRKPIIYTGKYFWQDNVKSYAFSDYPLWIPNYSYDCPNLPNDYWNDWIFFQYTSTGSVSGVSGNVDRDKFNGTLADLLAFANGGPKYAAKFVSQSFPYASNGPQTMYAGDVVDAHIEMQNVGTATWDSNTLLGTTEPRDRISPFAGPEWPGPNRYARVEGTVPPGGTYKFTFKLHAPLQPGIYDEHFGLVQESVAWFSDPGQGGPPDGQLEGIFEVLPAPAGTGGSGGESTGSGGESTGSGGNGSGGYGNGSGGYGNGSGGYGTPPGWGNDDDSGISYDTGAQGSCAMLPTPYGMSGAAGLAALSCIATLVGRRRQRRPASL